MIFSSEIKEAILKHKMHLIPLYLFPFYYVIVIFLDLPRYIHFLLYIPVFIAAYFYAAAAVGKGSYTRKVKVTVLLSIPLIISAVIVAVMIAIMIFS